MGVGAKPQAGYRAAALTFLIIKKAVSEQNVKHSAIETGAYRFANDRTAMNPNLSPLRAGLNEGISV